MELGVGESACTDSNPTCNRAQLLADNRFNDDTPLSFINPIPDFPAWTGGVIANIPAGFVSNAAISPGGPPLPPPAVATTKKIVAIVTTSKKIVVPTTMKKLTTPGLKKTTTKKLCKKTTQVVLNVACRTTTKKKRLAAAAAVDVGQLGRRSLEDFKAVAMPAPLEVQRETVTLRETVTVTAIETRTVVESSCGRGRGGWIL